MASGPRHLNSACPRQQQGAGGPREQGSGPPPPTRRGPRPQGRVHRGDRAAWRGHSARVLWRLHQMPPRPATQAQMRWTGQWTGVISQKPLSPVRNRQSVYSLHHAPQSGRAELWGGRDPAQDDRRCHHMKTCGGLGTLGVLPAAARRRDCSKPSRGPNGPQAPPLSDCSKRPRGDLVLTSQPRWPSQQPPLPL